MYLEPRLGDLVVISLGKYVLLAHNLLDKHPLIVKGTCSIVEAVLAIVLLLKCE